MNHNFQNYARAVLLFRVSNKSTRTVTGPIFQTSKWSQTYYGHMIQQSSSNIITESRKHILVLPLLNAFS